LLLWLRGCVRGIVFSQILKSHYLGKYRSNLNDFTTIIKRFLRRIRWAHFHFFLFAGENSIRGFPSFLYLEPSRIL
jgi:hypothetical protein